ncbi:MAG: GH3 auxin-responsive promoter family protein [Gemmatimonadaceae bacterium]|nr:GH3 auxin-responsive promoter family protein [Gemmatimonadaceae bacterium]
MRTGASLANVLWLARNAGAAVTLARALGDTEGAQTHWLKRQLLGHSTSEFGQRHDVGGIRDYDDFARRVPLCDYEHVAPFIPRILRGEHDVLACGTVTHLAPTSGSSGGRKLIPFTATLQEGFSAAVGAWMVDLARQRPRLLGGPAYWSVSPLAEDDAGHEMLTPGPLADRADVAPNPPPSAAVPIGFVDDADYLGGSSAWLVRQALAAPATLRHVRDTGAFWALTVLALLRQRDLRLISIWHPSFLDLLMDAATANWPMLLDAIANGDCPWADALPAASRDAWRVAPAPARAKELRRIGAADWPRWWPRLQVVSCWGEQAAEAGWARLRRTVPGVLVQAKGLLATEGVVTIPLGSLHVLAVSSHYYEFLDERGEVHRAHQLARGHRYEVVVTNGGGLWRYRLGDVVECTGHVRTAPSLRFLGRAGHGSDLRGEKLTEVFVAESLRALWPASSLPEFAVLRSTELGAVACYELLVSPDGLVTSTEALAQQLDQALHANPHYALARRLGQLAIPRIVPVPADGRRAEIGAHAGRLGDAKPRVLLTAGSRGP